MSHQILSDKKVQQLCLKWLHLQTCGYEMFCFGVKHQMTTLMCLVFRCLSTFYMVVH